MAREARQCDVCGGVIPAFTVAYTLRIQLFAEAGPVDITPDDLYADHKRRMAELIEEAKDADPQDLMDQVYESFTLTICPGCRGEMHADMNRFLRNLKDTI